MRRLIKFKAIGSNQRGATVVEYCLIAGIIVFAIVAALTELGTELEEPFNQAAEGFEN